MRDMIFVILNRLSHVASLIVYLICLFVRKIDTCLKYLYLRYCMKYYFTTGLRTKLTSVVETVLISENVKNIKSVGLLHFTIR